MFLLIRYPAGIIVEALVLAKGKNRMRVAAAGFPDTVELTSSGGRWFTGTYEEVEFEFLMPLAHFGEGLRSSTQGAVARAAG